MSSDYAIKMWDVVLRNNHRVPIIYIKPDLAFIEFVRKNNFEVVVVIQGTNLPYDGNKIRGIVNVSSLVPNCRPNFFSETGLYVVELQSSWNGYPSEQNLGTVKLFSSGFF